jgi:phosphatidylethanolamine-binding protein (PEBP) family uncharacterized protein
LKWAGVSPTTKEVVVFIRSFVTLGHTTNNWAVAGLSPSLQQIPAGKLPAGAIEGRNSFGQTGYNLCLIKGASHMLVSIDIWAVPHKLSLKPGFDPEQMIEEARSPGSGWGSILGYLGPPAH